jgi:ABC-2 type transport system ATP-binding protein
MSNVISFEHVKKEYREGFWQKRATILPDLSFSVPKGKIFGFLGANGAGKTTSIKLMLGLQRPTSGKIRILGATPADHAVRANLGYLPERPYFQENLTATEFLDFHRSLYGKYLKENTPRNLELLATVGLKDVEHRLLKDFSKGMLQRVGIAQSLVNDPELVILDEPMSGLDPVGRKEIRNLIGILHQQGRTVFFSTHILSDVEEICDEIAFLEKGELKYSGAVTPLLKDNTNAFEIVFSLPKGDGPPSAWRVTTMSNSLLKLNVMNEVQAKTAIETIWKSGGNVERFNRVTRTLEEALFGNTK